MTAATDHTARFPMSNSTVASRVCRFVSRGIFMMWTPPNEGSHLKSPGSARLFVSHSQIPPALRQQTGRRLLVQRPCKARSSSAVKARQRQLPLAKLFVGDKVVTDPFVRPASK